MSEQQEQDSIASIEEAISRGWPAEKYLSAPIRRLLDRVKEQDARIAAALKLADKLEQAGFNQIAYWIRDALQPSAPTEKEGK